MMQCQRMSSGVAPLLLRLALAVTFIWAGLGKIVETTPVSGQRAATLANMGVSVPNAPVLPTPTPGGAATPPTSAADPMPADGFRPGPVSLVPEGTAGEGVQPQPAPAPAGATAPLPYAASDFPEPVEVRRVYGLALKIHGAANPPLNEDGKQMPSLWPARLAQDSAPKWLAWAVALAELGGGTGLLIGLLTRLSALSVAGVMLGAMWLDQIGPAVQAGQTVLGFLPSRPAFDTEAWRPLLWQFMLFMAAMAVVFAGAGMLAIDNILFNRSRGEDDDDDE